MNEENHRGWKLVAGVRRDVVKLFEMFTNTNSLRYEDFCKVWKELGFSLIFSNRNSFNELLEFSEELLQIVKEYLLPVYEVNTRVGAVYALYGLYFKQPISGAAKIRFTKTEWEEVYALTQLSKSAQHYDVSFVFLKLYLAGAFSFTATVRQAGLEKGFKKYSEKKSTLHTKACDVELLYRPLISEKLVNSFVKLESLYCRKKSELLGKRNLVFIDGEFAKSLQEELQNYKHQSKHKSKVNVRTQGAESEQNESILKALIVNENKMTVQDTKDPTQLGTSSGGTKRKRNGRPSKNFSDEETLMKMRKFSKRYFEVLAKKKAEFYIKKLQSESNMIKNTENSLDTLDSSPASDTAI